MNQRQRIKVHYDKLRESKKSVFFLIIDLLMVSLVVISLCWMILDWHFTVNFTRNFLQEHLPTFFNWYDTKVHPNYFEYDSYFIAVFITELVIRWIVAIFQNKYYKWWFYPFIHWYDVLGCLPVGSFRVLRLLRVYGMIIRLDKKGFIDIKHTGIYRLIKRNVDILSEEVSDRVVDNVLEGMQEEVYSDQGTIHKIVTEVIQPNQEHLVEWLAIQFQQTNSLLYQKFSKDFEKYLKKNIEEAVHENREMKRLDNIPLVGKQITEALEHAISDITFRVINKTIKDLADYNMEDQLNEVANITLDSLNKDKIDDKLAMVIKEMVVQSLDVVREQVATKQWKIKEKI